MSWCETNIASLSLSDEEGERSKAGSSKAWSPLLSHAWGLGCIGRHTTALSRSFSNIADGLRLTHTHTLAVAGVVMASTSAPSSPEPSFFRRGDRASFHGRGSARPLTFPTSTPSTHLPLAPVSRPKLPIPPRPSVSHHRTLPNVPGPSTFSAKASAFLSKDSQLLSVKSLLQQVASLRPRAVLASLSPRPCHRFLPRPPLAESQSHPKLHSSSSSIYSSNESIGSQTETPRPRRRSRRKDASEVSSMVSEVPSGKIRIPEHSPVYEFRSQCNPRKPHKCHKTRLIRPAQVSRLSNHSDCCHFFNKSSHICRYQDEGTYNSPPPPAPSQSPVTNSPLHTVALAEESPEASPNTFNAETAATIYPFPSTSAFALPYETDQVEPGPTESLLNRFEKSRGSPTATSQVDIEPDLQTLYYAEEAFPSEVATIPRTSRVRSYNPMSPSYHLLHQYLQEDKVPSPPPSPSPDLHMRPLCSLPETQANIITEPPLSSYDLPPPTSASSDGSKHTIEWDETNTEAVSEKFAALFTQDMPCPASVSNVNKSQTNAPSTIYSTSVEAPISSSSTSIHTSLVHKLQDTFRRKDKSRRLSQTSTQSSSKLSAQTHRIEGPFQSSSVMSLSLR